MNAKKYENFLDACGSALIPGLGQMMKGRWKNGFIFMFCAAVSALMFLPAFFVLYVWSLCDCIKNP